MFHVSVSNKTKILAIRESFTIAEISNLKYTRFIPPDITDALKFMPGYIQENVRFNHPFGNY